MTHVVVRRQLCGSGAISRETSVEHNAPLCNCSASMHIPISRHVDLYRRCRQSAAFNLLKLSAVHYIHDFVRFKGGIFYVMSDICY